MGNDKPIRRMTLRQLLTHAEKSSRELAELVQATLLVRISDFRDLSRPIRRRSHYPTMLALQNALRRLTEASEETQNMITYLNENLEAIREHAQREKVNRR